jgi:hypothetical protein
MAENEDSAKGFDFKAFATPRIIGGIVVIIIVLWALTMLFGTSDKPETSPGGAHQSTASHEDSATSGPKAATTTAGHAATATTAHSSTNDTTTQAAAHEAATVDNTHQSDATASHGTASNPGQASATTHDTPSSSSTGAKTASSTHGDTKAETPSDRHPIPDTPMTATVHKPTPKGVAFVEAAIKPMEYELEERWWGWRPNDIVNVTDNVNNFQLGVLEITRRTVVALAERISRHGVTDSLDPNLEEAMNWFMVKASSYWFPSAESKYKDGLEEMRIYLEKLKAGKATFFIRSDNLIPLLASFEDLLGSCDENLVKDTNEDGTPVSFFKADDYFYYTKGVASAMAMVLEAVHHDFLLTLESRNATELLHHAIVSCQRAAELDPWIILDRDLSSVFSNHRANMAAPISHARFYLGQLVKTLST